MSDQDRLDLVTGAFSYTGGEIARRLLESGRRVRTLTFHPDRAHALQGEVEALAYSFDDPVALARSLDGVSVLHNTYWVRFDHGRTTFADAIENSRMLFAAARRAGVERIVHVSITNPSISSPLPYFRGKALVERALAQSGVPFSIVRPTWIFGGRHEILANNIAWILRHLPVFAIPGDGDYLVAPVHVDDLARSGAAPPATCDGDRGGCARATRRRRRPNSRRDCRPPGGTTRLPPATARDHPLHRLAGTEREHPRTKLRQRTEPPLHPGGRLSSLRCSVHRSAGREHGSHVLRDRAGKGPSVSRPDLPAPPQKISPNARSTLTWMTFTERVTPLIAIVAGTTKDPSPTAACETSEGCRIVCDRSGVPGGGTTWEMLRAVALSANATAPQPLQEKFDPRSLIFTTTILAFPKAPSRCCDYLGAGARASIPQVR